MNVVLASACVKVTNFRREMVREKRGTREVREAAGAKSAAAPGHLKPAATAVDHTLEGMHRTAS